MINGVTLYYGSNASSISGGEVVFQLPANRQYNTTLGAQGRMQNVSTHIFSKLSPSNL